MSTPLLPTADPTGPLAPSLPSPESELQAHISTHPLTASLRSDPNIQETRYLILLSPEHLPTHLTHTSLSTPSTLPVPPVVFTSASAGKIWAFYRLGAAVAGHKGVVHGGFTATLLDEVMGMASLGLTETRSVVTAELKVTYKAPVRTESCILVRAQPERVEGRKAWMKGWVEDLGSGRVCVEATSLFIVPKDKGPFTEFK
ncbi:MAG: hypothetical protein MMC23_007427 [Stictis urceolatum]|nr:hypothetical protein [Stictis urceolata]